MTTRERREFCNLLAKGRGLPPVYDLTAEDEDDALVSVAISIVVAEQAHIERGAQHAHHE
jgi:hypothetical protein